MSKALVRALEKRRKAYAEVDRILKRDYPEGSEVAWKRHGIHEGVVILAPSGDRIKVRNGRTGKEFWIHAYDIVEAMALTE